MPGRAEQRARSFIVAAIVLLSLANVMWSVQQNSHVAFFKEQDLKVRERALGHAKSMLRELGVFRIAYFDEQPGWIDDGGEFFQAQYMIAPIFLDRDSDKDPWALVNFRISKKPAPRSGYELIEDLGNGLVLYRKL